MANCIHNHSRWETGDQIGAAGHFLTPEKTLSALTKVKQGRIIDLSHTIEMGAPFMAPNQTPDIISSPATCLLYTSPSPRDKRQSRMPSSA